MFGPAGWRGICDDGPRRPPFRAAESEAKRDQGNGDPDRERCQQPRCGALVDDELLAAVLRRRLLLAADQPAAPGLTGRAATLAGRATVGEEERTSSTE